MLIMFLVILSVIAWTGIVVVYFKEPLYKWWDNRFGKDTPPTGE